MEKLKTICLVTVAVLLLGWTVYFVCEKYFVLQSSVNQIIQFINNNVQPKK